MLKININEFQDYDSKSMYEYLLVQNDTEFEIIIPREAVEGIDDQYILAVDFIGAAYAGQLLSEISNCFAYYTPCPNKTKPFCFRQSLPTWENWLIHSITFPRVLMTLMAMKPF